MHLGQRIRSVFCMVPAGPADSPRVSIILPVRDAAATLPKALESILAQDDPFWELVLIDDGSTDESLEVVAQILGADPRLRLVRQGRLGLVPALEAGLADARAPLFARMDADDVMNPSRLRRQRAYLEEHPDVGVVGSLVQFGGDPVAQMGYALHVEWLNTLCSPDDIAMNRFVESPLAHPSVMFRRSLVDQLGGYRSGTFPEDYELWLRWMDAGVRVAKVPEVLLTWNDPPGRLSRGDPRYGPEAFYKLKASWLCREVERHRRGRDVWLWGSGRPTRQRAAHFEHGGLRFSGFVDVDPRKQGQWIEGRPVVSVAGLPPPTDAVVVNYVARRGARQLIRGWLGERGYVEGRDSWMAA